MTHFSIIGTGNMGQAIAGIVTKGGSTVQLIDTNDSGPPARLRDLRLARGAR